IGNGWLVKGGPGAIADGLAAAARGSGVEIRTGAEVVQIEVSGGTASAAVIASGERIAASTFVSNADPKRTFGLVDPAHFEPAFVRRTMNIRTRGTLAKVN